MITLHGTWVPDMNDEHQSAFVIWGEKSTEQDSLDPNLGFFCSCDELRSSVSGLANHDLISFVDGMYNLNLMYDSLMEGVISCVYISLHQGNASKLLQFLAGSRNEVHNYAGEVIWSERSQPWFEAASLTREILKAGHYLPSLTSELKVFWEPVILKPLQDNHIRSFITLMLNQYIRDTMSDGMSTQILRSINPRYSAPLTPAEHWLHSLISGDVSTHIPAMEWIVEDVEHLVRLAKKHMNQISYRTCLLLEEPSSDSENEWKISFLLQVVHDPSIVVTAHEVWLNENETMETGSFTFEFPQERLLQDLDKAAQLFHPVKSALKQPCPQYMVVNTDEAYQFLQHSSGLLKQQGIHTIVPDWWRDQRKTPRLHMQLFTRDKHDKPDKLFESRPFESKPFESKTYGFHSLLHYEWLVSLGDRILSKDEFGAVTASDHPLMRIDGQWMVVNKSITEQMTAYLNEKSTGAIRMSEALQLALYPDAESSSSILGLDLPEQFRISNVQAEGNLGLFFDKIRHFNSFTIHEQPIDLQGTLRPYQVNGLSWLIGMKSLGLGACLADDMGLGKTVQWIAYILYLQQNDLLHGTALLICPTSIISNWQRELERFAPTLSVWTHYGPQRLVGESLASIIAVHQIILTSYSMAQRDGDQLAAIQWDSVTLDEAQNIKNIFAKRTKNIRKFRAGHKIALTGTPVENRLSELWSIMDFLNPDYLGTRENFQNRFAKPIEKLKDTARTDHLHRIVQPFLLRRLKSDQRIINDLPEKLENNVYCALSHEQVVMYEAYVRHALRQMEKTTGMERKGMILGSIMKLKQICNDPSHFLKESTMLPNRSGKLMRLTEMLEEIMSSGERSLIFTQYAQFAKLLHGFLVNRYKQEVLMIHGGVPKNQRDLMIDRFQSETNAPNMFILSLKTGGYGINLTRANHVFHYDRWWNPAVENQATDRAYRIGQQKNVQVHKFICSGTLEEQIDKMIESKRNLASTVVGSGEDWLTEMSTEELQHVFMLRKDLLLEAEEY